MAQRSIPKTCHPSTGVFTEEEIDYFDSLGHDYFPSEETHKVSESDWHYYSVQMAVNLLMSVFRDRPDVYIAANHSIYWDKRHKQEGAGKSGPPLPSALYGPPGSFASAQAEQTFNRNRPSLQATAEKGDFLGFFRGRSPMRKT